MTTAVLPKACRDLVNGVLGDIWKLLLMRVEGSRPEGGEDLRMNKMLPRDPTGNLVHALAFMNEERGFLSG